MTWGLPGHVADAEWWQFWTCHLAHWDWRHLAWNAVAALPPILLVPRAMRRRLLHWILLAAPLLSAAIAGSFTGEYRGASGLVVALWMLTGTTLWRNGERQLGAVMVLCLAAKLLAELAGVLPRSSSFETLSVVHYAGAAIGAFSGVVWPLGRAEDVSDSMSVPGVASGDTPATECDPFGVAVGGRSTSHRPPATPHGAAIVT